jgi:hypothetical protein
MGKSARRKDNPKTVVKIDDNVSDDWITALAKKERLNGMTSAPVELSKSERIAKRDAKKIAREDRKTNLLSESARKNNKNGKTITNDIASNRPTASLRIVNKTTEKLTGISQKIIDRVTFYKTEKQSWKKPYSGTPVKPISNTRKRKLEIEDVIQPRRCDYGGIGLARPSLWIAIDDPSCQPKIEEEFAEHVDGFFGKQRTKAMKKQLDGNMLWRQIHNKTNVTNNLMLKRLNGKKLSEMNPDERVEAMLKAGII